MARIPDVRKFPDKERRELLETFLTVLDQHPDLAHFRATVTTGPERQLALIAAFERHALLGGPALHPPKIDDPADMLLCEILDIFDRDPELKRHGCAYGPQRHVANLIVLGIWDRKAIPTKSVACELFTTRFSNVSADAASTLPFPADNLSPASQESAPSGDLIGPPIDAVTTDTQPLASPELLSESCLAANLPNAVTSENPTVGGTLIHHEAPTPGEQIDDGLVGWDKSAAADAGPPSPALVNAIPPRHVRRGRPVVLDELAKGRILGLMSYGLSFRQAAAQLGVHHVTILNLLKRDAEFAQQVSEARLDAISQPLLTVVHASRTNWRAAAWLAKFLEERRIRNYESTPEERKIESMQRS